MHLSFWVLRPFSRRPKLHFSVREKASISCRGWHRMMGRMPATPPSSPRDVADILEAIARRLRSDPSFASEFARGVGGPARVSVSEPAEVTLPGDDAPDFGEVDVVLSDSHVTVTADTSNADQTQVHVSVMDRQLILCIGEGDEEKRRSVRLPCDVDEENAAATFRNGILDVVLPVKRAQTEPQPRGRA